MKQLPDKIYIIDPFDANGNFHQNAEDVCWCADPAGDVNIAYVSAEKVAAALATLEQSLRPDLFHTLEFYQAAMQIIEITREQLQTGDTMNNDDEEIEHLATAKETGKPLNLEARLLGAMAIDYDVTLDKLAEIKGVIIERQGDRLVVTTTRYKNTPRRMAVPNLSVSHIIYGGVQQKIVMRDELTSSIWFVPDED